MRSVSLKTKPWKKSNFLFTYPFQPISHYLSDNKALNFFDKFEKIG